MVEDQQVTVRDNPRQDRFELLVDGAVAGYAAYRHEGGALAVTHVEVDDGHEGEGLGSRLVGSMLAEVRGRGTPVLPYCPFVRGYLRKHLEEQDVVPAADRARFGLGVFQVGGGREGRQ